MSARATCVEAFTRWLHTQPHYPRMELLNGEVFAMSPERRRHARAKGAAYIALSRAVADAGAPCEVFADGLAVHVSDDTWFIPDASIECNETDNPDDTHVIPCVIVEVLSPGTASLDAGAKLHGYFSLPSLVHYLIVDPVIQSVIVHTRKNQRITTTIHTDSQLQLITPDIQIDVGHFFTRPSR